MKNSSNMNNVVKFFSAAIMLLVTIIFVAPFYISLIYSFKTSEESAFSPLGFPKIFHFENYTRAIKVSNFFTALKNSTLVTVVTVILLILISSMAAYVISRNNKPFYNFFYYLFLASVMLPFQAVMFPLYKMFMHFHLVNSYLGLILAITGFNVGFDIFVYTGFFRSLPRELEESAMIDGCSEYRAFWQIVFPVLKPVNLTVAVLAALVAWNDFQISMIFVQKKEISTLPLSQYYFIGQYSVEINMAFAAVILSMIPLVIFYLFAQKYIISGVATGAVKG